MFFRNDRSICFQFGFGLLVGGLLIVTILSTLVYIDYRHTTHFEPKFCRGTGPLLVHVHSTSAQGKISGCVSDPQGYCIGENVTLTYPPVQWFQNTFTTDIDVYMWASAVFASPAIACQVGTSKDQDELVAYTNLYLYGFLAMIGMICGVVYFTVLLIGGLCTLRYAYQIRRAEYSSLS